MHMAGILLCQCAYVLLHNTYTTVKITNIFPGMSGMKVFKAPDNCIHSMSYTEISSFIFALQHEWRVLVTDKTRHKAALAPFLVFIKVWGHANILVVSYSTDVTI